MDSVDISIGVLEQVDWTMSMEKVIESIEVVH